MQKVVSSDLKDPFNGAPKAVLVGFTYFLTLVPWMTILPSIVLLMIQDS